MCPLQHQEPEFLNTLRLSPEATLPTRAHPSDAGLDLYGLDDNTINPFEGRLARTGVAMAIPEGFVGLIADRSSLAKKGLKTAGGVIDAGYRGEIMVVLRNLTPEPIRLARGERIAQLLLLPVATPAVRETQSLDTTDRGSGGFGSSGK